MKSFKNLRSDLKESTSLRGVSNPPALLVLKRRGLRMFPDGQKIAMYINDKYNMMFTVPYGSNTLNAKVGPLVGVQTEENLKEYVNVFKGVGDAAGDVIKSAIKRKYGPPPRRKKKRPPNQPPPSNP